MAESNVLTAVGFVAIALLVLGSAWFIASKEVQVNVPEAKISEADKASIVDAIKVGMPKLEQTVSVQEGNLTQAIYDKLFEDERKESKALALTSDVLKDKNFKKVLVDFLNSELNASGSVIFIEDVDDVILVDVLDSDVTLTSDTDASVYYKLKVKYVLDGDKEETGKAKVELNLNVVDLDVDEDFENAETEDVESDDFDLLYFYD